LHELCVEHLTVTVAAGNRVMKWMF